MQKIKYSLIAVVFALASCSEETLPGELENFGIRYFPLEEGAFRIYDVSRIEFTLLESDTSSFQLRERITEAFDNDAGSISYVVERSTRPDAGAPWVIDSIWTARVTESVAILNENNVPLVKLVFPIIEDSEWDGNIFNSNDEDIYTYRNVFAPGEILGTVFNNTVTVVQSEISDNLILRDERIEIYAEDVGLIHKDFVVLNFCARQDCLGQGIIDSGIILKMDLIENGTE
ncbi:MAG: hypothetical protein RJQ09_04025 [Cyclobacteriaceae bacterium]